MFKNGRGVLGIFDKDYGTERSFQLYDEHKLLRTLEGLGMILIESESDLVYSIRELKKVPLLNNMTNCAVEVTIVHYYWIKLLL